MKKISERIAGIAIVISMVMALFVPVMVKADPDETYMVHTSFYGEGGTYNIHYSTADEAELEKQEIAYDQSGVFIVPRGVTVTLEATPDMGYHFKSWSTAHEVDVDGQGTMRMEPLNFITNETIYTFMPTDSNGYYMPIFESDEEREVIQFKVSTTEGGKVSVQYDIGEPNPNNLESEDGTTLVEDEEAFDIYEGTNVTLIAQADEGYRFKGWFFSKNDWDGTGNRYEDDMIDDRDEFPYQPGVTTREGEDVPLRDVCAVFIKEKEYTLTANGATVIFTYEEGHDFQFSFLDVLKLTPDELEMFDITEEEFNQILELIKANTKEYGDLLGVYAIDISDDTDYYGDEAILKIKITDEMKKYNTFKFIYLDDENNFVIEEIVDFKVEGDYIVANIPHFSAYALVGSYVEENNEDEPESVKAGDSVWGSLIEVLAVGSFIVFILSKRIRAEK